MYIYIRYPTNEKGLNFIARNSQDSMQLDAQVTVTSWDLQQQIAEVYRSAP